MSPLIAKHRLDLAKLCREFGVECLEVFGSAARLDHNLAHSDIDFIVRFYECSQPGYADRYLDLAENLESLLGRPVDLITERSLKNPIFINAIAEDRTTVYDAQSN